MKTIINLHNIVLIKICLENFSQFIINLINNVQKADTYLTNEIKEVIKYTNLEHQQETLENKNKILKKYFNDVLIFLYEKLTKLKFPEIDINVLNFYTKNLDNLNKNLINSILKNENDFGIFNYHLWLGGTKNAIRPR